MGYDWMEILKIIGAFLFQFLNLPPTLLVGFHFLDMLQSVCLKNFYSYSNETIDLQGHHASKSPLCILVGENGSGKSNIIRFISQVFSGELDKNSIYRGTHDTEYFGYLEFALRGEDVEMMDKVVYLHFYDEWKQAQEILSRKNFSDEILDAKWPVVTLFDTLFKQTYNSEIVRKIRVGFQGNRRDLSQGSFFLLYEVSTGISVLHYNREFYVVIDIGIVDISHDFFKNRIQTMKLEYHHRNRHHHDDSYAHVEYLDVPRLRSFVFPILRLERKSPLSGISLQTFVLALLQKRTSILDEHRGLLQKDDNPHQYKHEKSKHVTIMGMIYWTCSMEVKQSVNCLIL
jgi:energy-coupling factor transporter ATP-binding protein EcfA2